MALDFHSPVNSEILFSLDDTQFNDLLEIFEQFTQWTGLRIDQHDSMKLTVENQKTLITIIDKYIGSTDLNKDKQKTTAIIGFRGLLVYFVSHNIDLKVLGD